MKVGDKVVCIRTNSQRRSGRDIIGVIKDNTYYIRDIYECCGRIAFDVGISQPHGFAHTICNTCRKKCPNTTWWQWSKLFAPIQHNSAHDELCKFVEERVDIEIKKPQLN